MRLNKIVNGIVSAWKSGNGNNANNNILLERILKQHRFKYHKLLGKYGNIEPSFLVYDIPLNTLIDLGRRFNQESVIIIDENGTYLYHLQDNKLDAFSHEHRFKGIKKFLSKQDDVSYDRNIDESFYYDDLVPNVDINEHLNPFDKNNLYDVSEFSFDQLLFKIVEDYQTNNPEPHFFSITNMKFFGNTPKSFKAFPTSNPRYAIVISRNKTRSVFTYKLTYHYAFYLYDFQSHNFIHITKSDRINNPELFTLLFHNLPLNYRKIFELRS